MSETRNLRNPGPGDVDAWRTEPDELELLRDAMRQAFLDGVRSFAMTQRDGGNGSTRGSMTSVSSASQDALHVPVRRLARAGGLPLRAARHLR